MHLLCLKALLLLLLLLCCVPHMQEQRLRPGEKIDMPVFFYIDPEFATDPKMKGINTITLRWGAAVTWLGTRLLQTSSEPAIQLWPFHSVSSLLGGSC